MPPHARMSLAQQLLLRALVATFWQQPYQRDLVRWGTDFTTTSCCRISSGSDFADVLDDLHACGFPLEPDWFAPHFEFRFPHIGELERERLSLELRQALEPWHVLGEEAGPGRHRALRRFQRSSACR